MATTSTEEHLDLESVGADRILAEVRKNCIMLSVTVKQWSGQFIVRGAEVKLDDAQMDSQLITAPRWKLLPSEWHKKLQKFVGEVRRSVYKVGIAFRDGVYLVPRTRAGDLIHEINSIKQKYAEIVDEFILEWPRIVEEQHDKIVREHGEERWFQVEHLLPTADSLREKFDVETALWPIGNSDADISCLQEIAEASKLADEIYYLEDLCQDENLRDRIGTLISKVRTIASKTREASSKLVNENVESWLQEVQATTDRLVASIADNMLQEPVKEFEEAVQNLLDISNRGGICRSGTLDGIRRAHSKLMGFQFMLPAQLISKIRSVESRIGLAEPSDINQRSMAGENLTKALSNICSEIKTDLESGNHSGPFYRRLIVSEEGE